MFTSFWRWLFPAPTTADIMASFTRPIQQLHEVEDRCAEIEGDCLSRMDQAEAELIAACQEHASAARAADRLEAFLGVTEED